MTDREFSKFMQDIGAPEPPATGLLVGGPIVVDNEGIAHMPEAELWRMVRSEYALQDELQRTRNLVIKYGVDAECAEDDLAVLRTQRGRLERITWVSLGAAAVFFGAFLAALVWWR